MARAAAALALAAVATLGEAREAAAALQPERGPSPLPLRASAGGCSPTSDVVARLAAAEPGRRVCRTPFYLDETTRGFAASGAALEQPFESAYGVPPGSRAIDDHIDARLANHLNDLHLLRSLRAHPARVRDPAAAAVHVAAILPLVSYLQGSKAADNYFLLNHPPSARLNNPIHYRRMQEAADGLEEAVRQLPDSDPRVYVVVCTHWKLAAVLGALAPLMQSPMGRRRIILAGSDLAFMNGSGSTNGADLRPNYVSVPYVASYRVDNLARHAQTTCRASARNASFFFAGSTARTFAGRLRGPVISAMTDAAPSSEVQFFNTPDYGMKVLARTMGYATYSAAYAKSMRRSRFCLVPAGDTATSRRLFDAMAAGCAPVYIGELDAAPGPRQPRKPPLGRVDGSSGQSSLPLRSTVDWARHVRFAGSFECLAADAGSGAKEAARDLGAALEREAMDQTDEEFERGCRARLAAYRDSLSYFASYHNSTGGVARALLTELYQRRGARPPRSETWPDEGGLECQ